MLLEKPKKERDIITNLSLCNEGVEIQWNLA